MLIYIAGPIGRGKNALANCDKAIEIALSLSRVGYAVVCVHALARAEIAANGTETEGRREQAMQQDLEILEHCDALVLSTLDYIHSAGTCEEVKHAKKLNKPVFVWCAKHARFSGLDTVLITGCAQCFDK